MDNNSCKEVLLRAWKMNECINASTKTESTHSFPKWQNGNRQGGKYVLKGVGKTFVGWGTYFILSNQFVRFFLELCSQTSRVFPCKLPSLISLSDMLHCTTTHQRPSVRWARGSKPRWEQSLCTPEHRGLPHSLSCQTQGRKRRNTSRKISTGSVIYDDLCQAPRLPHYKSSLLISFSLFIFSPRVSFSFPPAFCVCVPSCQIRCAPAHPQLHPATALPSSSVSLIAAHTLAKTAVCHLVWLAVMRFSFTWKRLWDVRVKDSFIVPRMCFVFNSKFRCGVKMCFKEPSDCYWLSFQHMKTNKKKKTHF